MWRHHKMHFLHLPGCGHTLYKLFFTLPTAYLYADLFTKSNAILKTEFLNRKHYVVFPKGGWNRPVTFMLKISPCQLGLIYMVILNGYLILFSYFMLIEIIMR
jgi:hypothetical protein